MINARTAGMESDGVRLQFYNMGENQKAAAYRRGESLAYCQKMAVSMAKAKVGAPASGGNLACPDNTSAKMWHLRDPSGKTHQFSNLAHFIREHPQLFRAEDTTTDRKKTVKSKHGIVGERLQMSKAYNGLVQTNRRPWKGWTCVTEQSHEPTTNRGG